MNILFVIIPFNDVLSIPLWICSFKTLSNVFYQILCQKEFNGKGSFLSVSYPLSAFFGVIFSAK